MSKTKKHPAAVALGRRGGKARSPAKAAAARLNGKKGGGRPGPRVSAKDRMSPKAWRQLVAVGDELMAAVRKDPVKADRFLAAQLRAWMERTNPPPGWTVEMEARVWAQIAELEAGERREK